MKKSILLVLIFFVTFSFSQERYKSRLFDVDITNDVIYAEKVSHLSTYHEITNLLKMYSMLSKDAVVAYFYTSEESSKDIDLKLDLYTPKDDSLINRPMVLVFHGGAMVAGAKDDFSQNSVNYCDSLAARGYVTASVQYRLGVTLTGEESELHIDSVDFARSVYRGVQDVRSAIRYVRANAKELGVDPNRVYLIGNSAGAILALENIYATKESEYPDYINKKNPSLGLLDAYGVKADYSTANGVVSLWGAVHSRSIVGSLDVPLLLVHGTADETVYFKTGRPLGNVQEMLTNTVPASFSSMMDAYTLNLEAPTLYGSYVIDSILVSKNIKHETYFEEGEDHEFYNYDAYREKVQKKVFDFLYSLTTQETMYNKPIRIAKKSEVQFCDNNLSFTINGHKSKRYRVVDLRGKTLQMGIVYPNESVNLNSLNNGVYMLQVLGEKPIKFGITK